MRITEMGNPLPTICDYMFALSCPAVGKMCYSASPKLLRLNEPPRGNREWPNNSNPNS
jgi:hypothetical protein